MIDLPINSVLPQISLALDENTSAVLQAPPGAGKTTVVPIHLIQSGWLGDKKIIMLEPRRLAARAAAVRMAGMLGENVGESVGYRIRLESKISIHTKVEVVTEGILTRILQTDPELSDYGLVIFDEYHERSLQADLGLALCLEAQMALRDDLRILVMSATLDGDAVSKVMGGAPIITSEGRSFPVKNIYGPETHRKNISFDVADKVEEVLRSEKGSVLVFLPGVGEIKRVHDLLRSKTLPSNVEVRPLYGDLALAEQRSAISTSGAGMRKVVLATSIAETSLTIEGVRVIVDCGYMRSPRFDPSSGMTRLETLRVSRASAEQRAGRAGRLEPGVCYRMWPEVQNGALAMQNKPEVLEADLCSLVLELLNWGTTDPSELSWCDMPPASSWKQAVEILSSLGAIDTQGRITPHGKAMSRLPVHPRLAHMLIMAKEQGEGWLGCLLAALLNERDVLQKSSAKAPIDLRLRLEGVVGKGADKGLRFDRQRIKQIKRIAEQYAKQINIKVGGRVDLTMAGAFASLAYPDRIGQLRKNSTGRFKLSSGKGAEIDPLDSLASEPYLVMTNVGGNGASVRVYQALALSELDVRSLHAERIASEDQVRIDEVKGIFLGERVERFAELILSAKRQKHPDQKSIVKEILRVIRNKGLSFLEPSEKAVQLCQRVATARCYGEVDDWPDFNEHWLLDNLDVWLTPYLKNVSSFKDLKNLDLYTLLSSLLGWDKLQLLNKEFPERFTVPTGNSPRINYNDPELPVLEVRLQELFGLSETPSILRGKVPLRLHLLSPARRPLQVTNDLAGFWQNTYHDVKKDMKGRYPRHYWPDDPLVAEPTSKTKKNMVRKR
ncbi:ATP-dependent helicase HrpB [Kiloniella antarctica]|uniref:ATP-dependent helicase HrpB n=1 Tax=Kiloniella antarctica TaxID=1550907 RepID=A0ABW5BNZ1_9PROT